ncbi:MAG TPA: succinate dehydrogenase assembly factor 2 [Alcanivorax sp.]|nr:succinate dehydrogenase assembly factor 2 [Alcanivorax sp.]
MTPPESLGIAEQKRRFHWQCRRGASEVEVVLNAYLERFFEIDDDQRRARFARLLECEDVDLLEWFTRRSRPQDPELRAFVDELLDRVATKN